jgi:YVTN family beta-propeller protein
MFTHWRSFCGNLGMGYEKMDGTQPPSRLEASHWKSVADRSVALQPIRQVGLKRSAILVCVVLFAAAALLSCGGSSGSQSSTGTPPPPPASFSIVPTPASSALVAGTNTILHVSYSWQFGFTGTVSVASVNGLPSGATVQSALPLTVSSSSGADLIIATSTGTAAGNYSVQIGASSGSLVSTATVNLSIGPRASYALTLPSPATFNLPQGSSTAVPVSTPTQTGIVDYRLNMSVTGLPPGVTASWAHNPGDLKVANALTLAAASNAAIGSHSQFVVVSTSTLDGQQQSGTLELSIVPASRHGDFVANYSNMFGTDNYRGAFTFDAKHHLVFASNPDMNRVDVLSSTTHQLLKSIPVPSPQTVDLTPDNSTLLVGTSTTYVVAIDTSSLQVKRRYTALPARNIVATNSGTAIISNRYLYGIAVLDLSTGVVTTHGTALTAPTYSWMVRTPDGSKVLLAADDNWGTVSLYDAASDTITNSTKLNTFLQAVATNADGSAYYAMTGFMVTLDAALNETRRDYIGLPITGWASDPTRRYLSMVVPFTTPVILTVDTQTMQVVSEAPSVATGIINIERDPPLWMEIPMTEDDTGMVIGIGDHGIVFDDSTNNHPGVDASGVLGNFLFANASEGPLSGGTSVQLQTDVPGVKPVYYFGENPAQSAFASGAYPTVAAPKASVPGPVNIRAQFPDGSFDFMPYGFTYGLEPFHLVDYWVASTGGANIDVFGFGYGADLADPPSVTIGGVPAKIQKKIPVPPTTLGYPIPLQHLLVTVPPGNIGTTNTTVATAYGSVDALTTVHYVDIRDFNLGDAVNNMLIDNHRQRLYVAGNNAVHVVSLTSKSLLPDITLPTIGGNRQFTAMALTPDGARLLVANAADGTVVVIDPDTPSNVTLVSLPGRNANPPYPTAVGLAATSTGKVFVVTRPILYASGPLVAIDLTTMTAAFTDFNNAEGTITATSDGTHVYIAMPTTFQWSADTNQWSIVGGSPNCITTVADDQPLNACYSEIYDSKFNLIARVRLPDIYRNGSLNLKSSKLNASGSLLYQLESLDSSYALDGVDIYDVKRNQWRERIELTEKVGFNALGGLLVTDADGKWLAVATAAQSDGPPTGIALIDLGNAPLSIGNLLPASGPSGTLVQLRGSGFTTSTKVTVDGVNAIATCSGPSTLQMVMPAHGTGPTAITVIESGQSYTLEAAFSYQ